MLMNKNFEKLRRIVLQNSALQKELQEITDRDFFVLRVVEIGRDKDLDLTNDDILEAMRENRRVWIERWI
jgi:hypothetical protein